MARYEPCDEVTRSRWTAMSTMARMAATTRLRSWLLRTEMLLAGSGRPRQKRALPSRLPFSATPGLSHPPRLARCISRDLRLRGFNYTSPTKSVVVDDTNVYHHRRRERVTLNSCVTCRLSVGMFNSLYDTCTARFIADHTMMQ